MKNYLWLLLSIMMLTTTAFAVKDKDKDKGRDPSYTYVELKAPNYPTVSLRTVANGINDKGQSVGIFQNAYCFCPFYRSEIGAFTCFCAGAEPFTTPTGLSIVKPPPVDTYQWSLTPMDINNKGQILAVYNTQDQYLGTASVVFTLDGQYADIRVPGSYTTRANAINDKGQVIGKYDTYDQDYVLSPYTSFLYEKGKVTPITGPSGQYVELEGIDNEGHIVGTYTTTGNASVTYSFVWFKGRFTEIEIRNTRNVTVTGISRDGNNIVGSYQVGSVTEGFVLDSKKVLPVVFPGAIQSTPLDVNSQGAIIGSYRNAEDDARLSPRGYIATVD